MRSAKVMSHYNRQIELEQCDKCGGIWFDESELFMARQGEAEKIEVMNAEILRNHTIIEAATRYCPRDNTVLQQFTDKYFPQDIILERCPSCHGIWLNRGTFTKYQEYRKALMRPKEKSAADKQMEERINQLVAAHESGQSTETLRKLSEFLSTPMDGSLSPRTRAAENVAGIFLNFIIAILRAFIFKF
ncbi:MAG: zf-TFIIB domain-containing protein [Dehalococcoidia bacterium]|nr:zf-TFIIB domain-containing protein [Dehalococcoidia bacterium]